jgi:hypothetical protein
MYSGKALMTAVFALASFPLLAQQPSSAPAANPAAPQNPPTQQSAPVRATPSEQASAPEAASVPMSAVNVELVNKLDSKTAKTGDDVVVKTKSAVKTSDGTEIPKGSKLMGHVLAVTPSGSGSNSQVALAFDHVEIKGGQTLAVRSQIESIAPAGAEAAAAPSAPAGSAPMSAPQSSGTMNPSAPRATAGATAQATTTQQPAQADSSAAAPAPAGYPAAGTVVAKNGNIAIATTSIPGVLLANNAPGQQDPRMAKASSILLGAKRDIQLDGGTQMTVGVAAAGAGQ